MRIGPFAAWIVGPAALALAAGACAFELGPEAWQGCLGRPVCEIGAVRIEAGGAGALLAEQIDRARGGVAGLGVARDPGNGFNDAELQGPVAALGTAGETITVRFARPHRIRSIDIAHLFSPAQIPADPPETAVIEGFAGDRRLGTLRLVHLGAARSGLEGPAAGHTALLPEAGLFRILEPFAGAAPDRLVFSAPPVPEGDSADYSVAGIAAEPAD